MSDKLTLWESAAEVEELLLSDEMQEAALEIAIPVFAERVQACVAVFDKANCAADYYKAEAKRLSDKAKVIENRATRIKQYIHSGMDIAGMVELEIGTKKVCIQKNPASVVIDDPNLIPAQFKVTEVITKIRKAEIKEALKSGEVAGCHTEQSFSLRIK